VYLEHHLHRGLDVRGVRGTANCHHLHLAPTISDRPSGATPEES
jgi:hypothetical protein